ncbi:MAG: hypothetical protein Q8R24_07280 [Legionellaceae bacterium]|nr:hypothetical protein [Legionellaceae bacterium]
MPTSSGTTVGTSQAPLPTLPRSPRIASYSVFNLIYYKTCPRVKLKDIVRFSERMFLGNYPY